jgi:hypothetical protein
MAGRVEESNSEEGAAATRTPGMGPEPTLLNRKEVDALYDVMEAVTRALGELGVEYVVTGGTLLGAVRQHSILFCDDDLDIAVIERGPGSNTYDRVRAELGDRLGPDFAYSVRPWEGGDKVRCKRLPAVFLDLFVLRRYETLDALAGVLSEKRNGGRQREEYVTGVLDRVADSAVCQGEAAPLCPFWHFNTRKAVELWPKVRRQFLQKIEGGVQTFRNSNTTALALPAVHWGHSSRHTCNYIHQPKGVACTLTCMRI